MSGFFSPQNPGIGGLDELTTSEELFVQNLSGLSYAQGDILYYNGTSLTRLAAGTNGHFLKTQGAGANPTWAAVSASPGGSDTQVQFNDGGSFGGDAGLTYNKTTDALTVAGLLTTSGVTSSALITSSLAGVGLRVVNTTDNASVQVAKFEGDRATMADNDEAYASLMLSDSGGTQTEFARLTWKAIDYTDTTEDGELLFSIIKAGTLSSALKITPSNYAGLPITMDACNVSAYALIGQDHLSSQGYLTVTSYSKLGTGTALLSGEVTLAGGAGGYNTWIGSGASEISANNYAAKAIVGGGTITEAASGTHALLTSLAVKANTVTVGAASVTNTATLYIEGAHSATVTGANYSLWVDSGVSAFGGDITPDTSDAAALGTSLLMWSDVFLADGAVINFNNGNATLTHSAGLLTSNVPISIGTSNALTAGTIELGHATDTTLSRSAAGIIAVEGVAVPTISSTDTLSNKTLTAPKFADAGLIADNNGNEQIVFHTTASATTYVDITNAATGTTGPLIQSAGETNVDLRIGANGTGKIAMQRPVNHGAFTAYFTETDNGNSSTADTIDWGVSNKQKSTLTGNCTFTFTAPPGPCSLILKLAQDATGSRTVTWPAAVHWSGGTAPTLTTTASKVDIITFYYDGSTYFGNYSLNFTA